MSVILMLLVETVLRTFNHLGNNLIISTIFRFYNCDFSTSVSLKGFFCACATLNIFASFLISNLVKLFIIILVKTFQHCVSISRY